MLRCAILKSFYSYENEATDIGWETEREENKKI